MKFNAIVTLLTVTEKEFTTDQNEKRSFTQLLVLFDENAFMDDKKFLTMIYRGGKLSLNGATEVNISGEVSRSYNKNNKIWNFKWVVNEIKAI